MIFVRGDENLFRVRKVEIEIREQFGNLRLIANPDGMIRDG
jgi:hypothetical protein